MIGCRTEHHGNELDVQKTLQLHAIVIPASRSKLNPPPSAGYRIFGGVPAGGLINLITSP